MSGHRGREEDCYTVGKVGCRWWESVDLVQYLWVYFIMCFASSCTNVHSNFMLVYHSGCQACRCSQPITSHIEEGSGGGESEWFVAIINYAIIMISLLSIPTLPSYLLQFPTTYTDTNDGQHRLTQHLLSSFMFLAVETGLGGGSSLLLAVER